MSGSAPKPRRRSPAGRAARPALARRSTSRPGSGSCAIAVLLVLVVNPLLRLLHRELPAGRQRRLHARQLRRRVQPLALSRGARQFARARRRRRRRSASLFGVPLAWALSRTDMPAKGLIWVSILGTFIIPPYLGAVGWILLAGPNAGWLNRAAVALTGADKGPFNIYSMPGLVLVTACYSFPYVFMFTKSALDLVSSEMEDAANILGAGNLRTTLSITLAAGAAGAARRLHPGVSRSDRLVRLAGPARACRGASTSSRRSSGSSSSIRRGSASPPPTRCRCCAVTVLLFWVQRRSRSRKGYVSLTGKGGERRADRARPWKWPLLGYCLFVCTLSFFMPMVVICQAALAKAWGRGFRLDNLTLHNLRFTLFENTLTRNATIHTFLYAGSGRADRRAAGAVHRLHRQPRARRRRASATSCRS